MATFVEAAIIKKVYKSYKLGFNRARIKIPEFGPTLKHSYNLIFLQREPLQHLLHFPSLTKIFKILFFHPFETHI